jgi:hypothetical protein
MRTIRTLAVLVPLLVVGCLGSPAAMAKGGNALVVIAGPGLPGGTIELRGDDALRWFQESGVGQLKFSGPNINGTIRPNADLGPAYAVSLTFGGPECPTVMTQTLYPYAPGGAQIFSPAGNDPCFGQQRAGYWSGPASMLERLHQLGVPADPARAGAESHPSAASIAASGDSGGPSLGVIVGFGLVAAAIAAGALARRREPRTAA